METLAGIISDISTLSRHINMLRIKQWFSSSATDLIDRSPYQSLYLMPCSEFKKNVCEIYSHYRSLLCNSFSPSWSNGVVYLNLCKFLLFGTGWWTPVWRSAGSSVITKLHSTSSIFLQTYENKNLVPIGKISAKTHLIRLNAI